MPKENVLDAQCWFEVIDGPWKGELIMCKRNRFALWERMHWCMQDNGNMAIVLGVRPEYWRNSRRAKTAPPREWCTVGVAASSSAPGRLGLVLAFGGEVEAQGRGSLHPHILVCTRQDQEKLF